MENKPLENRVWEKLEKKMAIENYSTIENINKKGDVKMKIKYMPKVVSFSILAVFLVGNIYTYATENKDIFTWMFDRIGISEKYEENNIEINEIQNSNDYTLTLENYGIDKDTLIMNFDLKSDKDFDFKFVDEQMDWTQWFYEKFEIVDENDEYAISDDKIIRMFDKVSENEYKIYEICKLDSEKIGENSKLKINIGINKAYDGPAGVASGGTEEIGKWDFAVEIDSSKINMEYEEYSFENKNIVLENVDNTEENALSRLKEENQIKPEVELKRLKKSNLATKITMFLKEYYTEPSLRYTVEVLDENNNIILEKDIEYLIGGVKQDIVIRDIDIDSRLKINVYEKDDYNGKIYSKGSIELDLAKDLVETQKKEIRTATQKWMDLEFEYDENAEVSNWDYPDDIHLLDFDYREDDGYIKFRIDVYCQNDEIEFTDLEELADAVKKLRNLGYYPSSEMKAYFYNEDDGEFSEEEYFSFDEMMKILDDENVSKNGKTYSLKNFENYQGINYSDNEKVLLDNGNINAVKYLNKTENELVYTFKIEENIYEIHLPSNLDYTEEVNEFVENIKLIK